MSLNLPKLPLDCFLPQQPKMLIPFPSSSYSSSELKGYTLGRRHHQRGLCFSSQPPSLKERNLRTLCLDCKDFRVFQGFKVAYRSDENCPCLNNRIDCHSRAVVLPTRNRINGRKKYGGVLPSILRDLKTKDDLEIILDSCGKLSPKEQTVVLKEQGSWERILRVFEWMKKQDDYVPNVIHFNIVLRSLGRAQKWDELRLCWVDMAKSGALPTNNTYAMLVDVYGKAGLVKEAVMWIKHMRSRGMFPDEVTMNTVVRVLKDSGKYDQADMFYKDWCVGRAEPEDLDFDSMDDCRNRSRSSAISFKHFLSTELFKTGGRDLNPKVADSIKIGISVRKPRMTATYNTLIDLYAKADRLKDAANVFAEMIREGVAMDTVTFNTMIFSCGSHGHLSESEALLSKMEEKGISPDTKTYNILLSLYANSGNIDGALACYRKIRNVGLLPDTVTHRAILHILCERNMVRDVEWVMEEMERFKIHIDEHTLPILVKMYVNEGLLDHVRCILDRYHSNFGTGSKTRAAIMDVFGDRGLWAEAEVLFFWKRDLSEWRRGVLEYNVMIKAYGKSKLFDKAFSLFKSMRNHGTWPDECTYNSLVQMFSGGDKVDQARELLAEMLEAGLRPQCLTFSALIASYVHLGQLSHAVDVYQEMEKAGVRPNEVVYGSLINGFSEHGKIEEALHYFHDMKKRGISANLIILTSLIKAYSKVGSLEGAKQIFVKMKEVGGPDVIASNSMISLYAEMGMVNEAQLIFEKLKEKGWADGVSFATMMYLYKNMGMLDEAIDVAEEMKDSGLLRDCASFNKIMACYATNGRLGECGCLLHDMVTRKILLDSGTFKVLFTVLKKGDLPTEAVMQLHSAYKEGKPYARHAIIASVYSIVGLHAFAIESCETFMKVDVGLYSTAYNVALYVYTHAGRIEEARNIYKNMQDAGIEADLVTYMHLVVCYSKAGMLGGVKRIYSQLKFGEIEPNESLFKAIMDAYNLADRNDLAELVAQEMRFSLDTEKLLDSESNDEICASV